MNTTKISSSDKSITLKIRRTRAQVRTSVSTGKVAARTTQNGGGCGYSCTTG